MASVPVQSDEAPASARSDKAAYTLAWLIVIAACAARFVNLDADPKFEYWMGYVTDEGRWTGTARNLALFGQPLMQDDLARLHLVLAPGFQIANYLVFSLAGVGFVSARVFTAFAGSAILLVSLLALRSHVRGAPLCIGVLILGSECLMLGDSRVAIPEMASLLFALLSFFTLVAWPRSVACALAAGLLLAVAAAMKGTTVLVVPVFLLMLLVPAAGESWRRRAGRCAAFGLGIVIPALGAMAAVVASGFMRLGGLRQVGTTLIHFVLMADPRDVVGRFLESPERRNVDLLLLGAWLGWCAWRVRSDRTHTRLEHVYRLSGIWLIGALITWSLLLYAPQRYLVHVIVPATIHLVAGLMFWKTEGPQQVMRRLDDARANAGIAFQACIVLPAALMLGIAVLDVLALFGVDNVRLRFKGLGLAILVAVLLTWFHVEGRRRISAAACVVFPIATAVAWMAVDEVIESAVSPARAATLVAWARLFVVAALAGLCFASRKWAEMSLGAARTRTCLGAVLAAGLMVQSAPTIFAPTYSIRDTSRSVRSLFPDDGRVRVVNAASILLETRLRYRETLSGDSSDAGIVVFRKSSHIPEGFAPVAQYWLAVHPLYCPDNFTVAEECNPIVTAYRNIAVQ